jgi:hypothetical protein
MVSSLETKPWYMQLLIVYGEQMSSWSPRILRQVSIFDQAKTLGTLPILKFTRFALDPDLSCNPKQFEDR